MKRYRVTLSADYRWPHARVAGREFNKGEEIVIPADQIGEEIKDSPLLDVKLYRKPRAKPKAEAPAEVNEETPEEAPDGE